MTTLLAAPLPDHSLPVCALVRYLVHPSYRQRAAALWGVSRRGARLLTADAPEPGMLVLLELPGPEPAYRHGCLACVTSAERAGEEGYVVQCRFARPLEADRLSLILREI